MSGSSRALDRCHSILDLRQLARRRLPSPIFHYLDGSAETEITARRNTSAFDDERLVPKCLDRLDVILDGGIRRGVHVLKALARGAKACSVGRAYLFGLSAGGEEGVGRALDILRTELVRAMKLSGCTDVGEIDGSIVRRFNRGELAHEPWR